MASDDTQRTPTQLVTSGFGPQQPQDTPTWYTPDTHIAPSLPSDDEDRENEHRAALTKAMSLQADSRARHVERRSLQPPVRSATMPAAVVIPEDAPDAPPNTMPNPWGSSQENLDISAIVFPEPGSNEAGDSIVPSFPQPDHGHGNGGPLTMPEPGVPSFPIPSYANHGYGPAPPMPIGPGEAPPFPGTSFPHREAPQFPTIPQEPVSAHGADVPQFPQPSSLPTSPVGDDHPATTKLDPLPPLPPAADVEQTEGGLAPFELSTNAAFPSPSTSSPPHEDHAPAFPAHRPTIPAVSTLSPFPQAHGSPSQPASYQAQPMPDHPVPVKTSDPFATKPPAHPSPPTSNSLPTFSASPPGAFKPSSNSLSVAGPAHSPHPTSGTAFGTGSKPPSKFDNYSQHQQQPPLKPAAPSTVTTSTPGSFQPSPQPAKPSSAYHSSAPPPKPSPSPAPAFSAQPPTTTSPSAPPTKPPVAAAPLKPNLGITEVPSLSKPPSSSKPPTSTVSTATSTPATAHTKPPKPSSTPATTTKPPSAPSKPHPTPTTSTPNLPTHQLQSDPEKQDRPTRPHFWSGKSQMETQYVNMLLALDDIPPLHNMAAGFFTWILLAGFILFPGTFESLENLGEAGTVDPRLVNAVKHVPLFVIAWVCTGIGIVGMIYCTYRWHKNYIWCLNKIFLPGFMNSLAGLLSTLANLFGVQHGELGTTSKITLVVTTVATGITGILTIIYSLWLVRRVKAKHDAQVGEQKTGKFGEGVTVKKKN